MAKNKNTRIEEEHWTLLRPGCHENAGWKIIHSIESGIYTVTCAECGKTQFRIMVQTKQW